MDVLDFIKNNGQKEIANPLYNPKSKKNTVSPTITTLDLDPDDDRAVNMALMDFKEGFSTTKDLADKYAKAGMNYNPWENLDKQLADSQSNWTKFGNALAQTLVSEIGLGTVKGASDLVDFIGQLVGLSDHDYSNPVSKYLEDKQEEFRNFAPIYRDESLNISNGGLTDFGWWASNMPSIASSLTLLIPAAGVTTGVKLLGQAAHLGKYTRGAVRAMSFANKTLDKGKRLNTFQKFINAPSTRTTSNLFLENGMTAAMSRTMENYQEARQVYNDMYTHISDNFNRMSDDEYQQVIYANKDLLDAKGIDYNDKDGVAKAITQEASDVTFKNDFANIAFDVIQMYGLRNAWKGVIGKAPEGASSVRRAQLDKLKYAGKSAEEIAEIKAKRSAAAKAGEWLEDRLYGSKLAIASEWTEGVEEAVNYISQEEGMTYGKILLGEEEGKRDYSFWENVFGGFDGRLEKYIHSPEMYDAAFWGVMGGVVFQGLGSHFNRLKNKLTDKKSDANDESQKDMPWYKLAELPENQRRISEIQGRLISAKGYKEKLDKINNGIDIYRTQPDGKEVQFANEEEQEAARQKLTSDYITEMTIRAMNAGNYDMLKEYFQDENVMNAFIELGMFDDSNNPNKTIVEKQADAKTFVENAVQQMEKVKDIYNEELIAADNAAAYLDKNSEWNGYVPAEYLNIIATNNTYNVMGMQNYDTELSVIDERISKLVTQFTQSGDLVNDVDHQNNVKLGVYAYQLGVLRTRRKEITDKKDLSLTDTIALQEIDKQIKAVEDLIQDTPSLIYATYLSLMFEKDANGNYKQNIHNREAAQYRDEMILKHGEKEAGNVYELLGLETRGLSKRVRTALNAAQIGRYNVVSNDANITFRELNPRNRQNQQTQNNIAELNRLYQTKAGLEISREFTKADINRTTEKVGKEIGRLHNSMNEARKKAINTASQTITDLYLKHKDDVRTYIKSILNNSNFDENNTTLSSAELQQLKDSVKVLALTKSYNRNLGAVLDDMFTLAEAIEAGQSVQNPTNQNQSQPSNQQGQGNNTQQPQNPNTQAPTQSQSQPQGNNQQPTNQNQQSQNGFIASKEGTSSLTNTTQGYIKSNSGLWIPVILPTRYILTLEDGTELTSKGDIRNAEYFVRNNVIAVNDNAGGTIEISPDKIVKIERYDETNNKKIDVTQQIQEEANRELQNQQHQNPAPSPVPNNNQSNTNTTAKITVNNNGEIKISNKGTNDPNAVELIPQGDDTYLLNPQQNKEVLTNADLFNQNVILTDDYEITQYPQVTVDENGKINVITPGIIEQVNNNQQGGQNNNQVQQNNQQNNNQNQQPSQPSQTPILDKNGVELKVGDNTTGISRVVGTITNIDNNVITISYPNGQQITLDSNKVTKVDNNSQSASSNPSTGEGVVPSPTSPTSSTESNQRQDVTNVELSSSMSVFLESSRQLAYAWRNDNNVNLDEVAQNIINNLIANGVERTLAETETNKAKEKLLVRINITRNGRPANMQSTVDEAIFAQTLTPQIATSLGIPSINQAVENVLSMATKEMGITPVNGISYINLENLLRYINENTNDTNNAKWLYSVVTSYLNSDAGKSKYAILDENIESDDFLENVNKSSEQRYREITQEQTERVDIKSLVEEMNEQDEVDEFYKALDKLQPGEELKTETKDNKIYIQNSEGTNVGTLPIPGIDPSTGRFIMYNFRWRTDVGRKNGAVESKLKDLYMQIFVPTSPQAQELFDIIQELSFIRNIPESRKQELLDKFKNNNVIDNAIKLGYTTSIPNDADSVDAFYKDLANGLVKLMRHLGSLPNSPIAKKVAMQRSINDWFDNLYNSYTTVTDMANNSDYKVTVNKISDGEIIRATDDKTKTQQEAIHVQEAVAGGPNPNIQKYAVVDPSNPSQLTISGMPLIPVSNFGNYQTYLVFPNRSGNHDYVQAYNVAINDAKIGDKAKEIYDAIKERLVELLDNFGKENNQEGYNKLANFINSILGQKNANTALLYGLKVTETNNEIRIGKDRSPNFISIKKTDNNGFYFRTVMISGSHIPNNESGYPSKNIRLTDKAELRKEIDKLFDENLRFNISRPAYIKSDNNPNMVLRGLATRENGKFVINVGNKSWSYDTFNEFVINNNLIRVNTKPNAEGTSNYNRVGVRSQKGNQTFEIKITRTTTSPVEENNQQPTTSKPEIPQAIPVIDQVKNILASNSQTKGIDIFRVSIGTDTQGQLTEENLQKLNSLKDLKLLPEKIIFDPEFNNKEGYANFNAEVNPVTGEVTVGQKWMDMYSKADKRNQAIRILIHEQLHNEIYKNQRNVRAAQSIYDEFKKALEPNGQLAKKGFDVNKLKAYLFLDENGNITKDGLEEFLVESLTSNALAKALNAIDVDVKRKGGPKTVWQQLLQLLADVFGWKVRRGSLYEQELYTLREMMNKVEETAKQEEAQQQEQQQTEQVETVTETQEQTTSETQQEEQNQTNDEQSGSKFGEDNSAAYDNMFSSIDESNITPYTTEMNSIKQQAIANGTFMKAPNGNPTNLNERQWLQVRTKNFINWFGDWINNPNEASKVVDENGEPLQVYHYSNDNIKEFSIDFDNYFSKVGNGTKKAIFFTLDNVEPGSENNFLTSRKHKIPVFLNIKDIKRYHGTKEDLHKKGTSYREVVNNSAEINDIDGGLVFTGFDDNKKFNQTIYIVHNPNQIKSAINNAGDFSTTNNNIRYSSIDENSIIISLENKNTKNKNKFNKSLFRGQSYSPKIDSNGNLHLKTAYDALSNLTTLSFDNTIEGAINYGKRTARNPFIIEIDEDYIDNILPKREYNRESVEKGENFRYDEYDNEVRLSFNGELIIPAGRFNIHQNENTIEIKNEDDVISNIQDIIYDEVQMEFDEYNGASEISGRISGNDVKVKRDGIKSLIGNELYNVIYEALASEYASLYSGSPVYGNGRKLRELEKEGYVKKVYPEIMEEDRLRYSEEQIEEFMEELAHFKITDKTKQEIRNKIDEYRENNNHYNSIDEDVIQVPSVSTMQDRLPLSEQANFASLVSSATISVSCK